MNGDVFANFLHNQNPSQLRRVSFAKGSLKKEGGNAASFLFQRKEFKLGLNPKYGMQNNKPYTLQRLKDYALWYYFRYYPSNARLLQKLKEKGTTEDSQQVFTEIKHLTQEDEIIKAKIDNYIFRNKNYRYIRQKMREKLFDSEKVESYLEKYINSRESILDENFLRKKIENYTAKGKSRYYIFQTLGETKFDREKLEILLEEYFPNGESENIRREYEKLQHKYDKQKIIQKLLSKGFKYDEVKGVIHE